MKSSKRTATPESEQGCMGTAMLKKGLLFRPATTLAHLTSFSRSEEKGLLFRPATTLAHLTSFSRSEEKRRQMTQEQAHGFGKLGMADLHMHSTYSDGLGTIEQILHHVEYNTTLDVIAVTDHDVIEGSLRTRDLWEKGNYRFDFVVGEEISTKEGHLLALYIEKRIQPGLSMERSIDLIHEQGGLAIVAHPLNRIFRHSCQRPVLDRILANGIVWLDGIETWNASFCGIGANQLAMYANRMKYGWAEVGNSDAHTLRAIGSGVTWFEGQTAQDVRASIEAGLSAPGGKLWDVNDYIRIAGHLISRKTPLVRNRKLKVA